MLYQFVIALKAAADVPALEGHSFCVVHADEAERIEVVSVFFCQLHIFTALEGAIVFVHGYWLADIDEARGEERVDETNVADVDGVPVALASEPIG